MVCNPKLEQAKISQVKERKWKKQKKLLYNFQTFPTRGWKIPVLNDDALPSSSTKKLKLQSWKRINGTKAKHSYL